MRNTAEGKWSTAGPGTGALAGIWRAVVAMSVFAPDLVSGSEQEHLPIAALTAWIWGLVASRRVMTTALRLDDAGDADDVQGRLVGFVAGLWTVAALVATLAPRMVTGSDPTRLPIAAMLAPVAAAVLTTWACDTADLFVARRRSQARSAVGGPVQASS